MALSGQANRIPSRVEFDAVQGAHSSSRFCPIVRATGGLIVLGIIAVAYGIHAAMGHEAAFPCIAGALFGWILQRTRFCFLCNFRDFFERREPHGVLTMVETVPFVSSIVEQIYICAIRRTTRRLAEAFPILHDLIAGYRSL